MRLFEFKCHLQNLCTETAIVCAECETSPIHGDTVSNATMQMISD